MVVQHGRQAGAASGRPAGESLGAAIVLGLLFLTVQIFEWKAKTFTLTSSAGSRIVLRFTITGFHMAHVVVGVTILAVVFAWSAARRALHAAPP